MTDAAANTQRYSIQLQGWPSGTPGQGVNSYACHWMRACTGTENAHPSPTVKTTSAPWTRPGNKAQGSALQAGRA